jgi:hypothetical protein
MKLVLSLAASSLFRDTSLYDSRKDSRKSSGVRRFALSPYGLLVL